MVYFPPDFHEQPNEPPDDEPMEQRCGWCEEYFQQAKSDAMNYRDFCSAFCEEQSANAERSR